MQKNNVIEISTGTIVKSILLVLLLFGLYFLRDIVAVVLFSIVVASAIDPIANWFAKRRIPRTVAIIFIYLGMFFVLGMVFYLVVPTFVSEISNFTSSVPKYFENPQSFQKIFGFLPISENSFSDISREIFSRLSDKVDIFASGFLQAAINIFGGVLSFLLIIVISFYLSVQKDGLESFMRIITPAKYESYVLDLWARSRKKIGYWLQGQILLGILVGVLVFLGLSILRVEYALTFALLAAVFELIPVFGPILASIPPIAIAFLQSPSLGIFVVILFIIIQQFENHLIYPLVVRKIVGIPPIMVVLSMIVGGTIGGLFGMLLAIPTATVLMEFLGDVAERKHIVASK